MSGHGLHYGSHHGFWESKGMYEDENTIVFNTYNWFASWILGI